MFGDRLTTSQFLQSAVTSSKDTSLASAARVKDTLEAQIARDQLEDVQAGLWVSMPISAALSTLILAMEHLAGNSWHGLIWFVCINLINGARLYLASGPRTKTPAQQLNWLKILAFLSGICWSYLAFLTHGFTQANSTFHLIILAGICAGAVTYGGSCAYLSVNFIAPPLLITIATFLLQGTFESTALAFAVGLFLTGLVRSAHMTEARFRELSRLRREAELFAQDMERSSREDPLTKLLNRRGFEHSLAVIKEADGPFGIMAIDLDGFKSVNDIYGHRTGDELLSEIAHRLAQWAPPHAILARLGGDEFAVVHRIEADNDLDEHRLRKLIGSITSPYPSVPSARIGACVGVYKTKNLNLTEMLLNADVALYAAKARGTNEFCFFDETLHKELERRQRIERDIPKAIEAGTLTTWFQPIVNLKTGRVTGFEALLRWTHPTHGPIPPPEIVAAAREIGMLASMTEMVFSNCCRLLTELNQTGHWHIKVAMNLSPPELEITDIDKVIVNGLRDRGLSTAQFEIEITEEFSLDYGRVDYKLKGLADAGISIALDDFGTGFSTFSSIKSRWINKIKIDKEFVKGSTSSVEDTLLVKSVIDLGNALGIEVSAEGVETEENARLLVSLGCDLAQGYLYSKPVPLSETHAVIERIDAAAIHRT